MKLLIIALIAAAFGADLVSQINSMKTTWTAEKNKFSDWSVAELKAMLSLDLTHRVVQNEPYTDSVNAPESFDSRDKWPACIVAVRDQAHCGSCWAFAASEVMSDRFCIAGCQKGLLSPQDLVSCDYMDSGCDGGGLETSWGWIKQHGICTDACMPYTSAQGEVEACPNKCKDGSDIVRYSASKYTHVSAGQIQDEIMNNGPVEVAFNVYQDFMTYKTGVYQHKTGQYLGGHAVKAIGWGVDNGVNYWLIQNSWNTNWGEKGYFRILRGKNECNIESWVYTGTPKC